jgi:hypothetical protein
MNEMVGHPDDLSRAEFFSVLLCILQSNFLEGSLERCGLEASCRCGCAFSSRLASSRCPSGGGEYILVHT